MASKQEQRAKELAKELAQKLEFDDSDNYERLADRFIKRCLEITKSPEYFPKNKVHEGKQKLMELCDSYFEFNKARLMDFCDTDDERGYHKEDHEDAEKVKTRARGMPGGVQATILSYLYAYLQVGSSRYIVQTGIDYLAEHGKEANIDVEWNRDLPFQVALMMRREEVLSRYLGKLHKMEGHVKRLDIAFTGLEQLIAKVVGKKKAQKAIKDFTGKMRVANYKVAQGIIDDVLATKKSKNTEQAKAAVVSQEIARMIVSFVKKNRNKLLGREGKPFLHGWELKMALTIMDRELARAEEFLVKHQVPEMRYRWEALGREFERLNKLPDIKEMLGELERLQTALFLPQKTMRDVRDLESKTLTKIEYISVDAAEKIRQTIKKTLELEENPDPKVVPEELVFQGLESAIPPDEQ